MPDTAPSARLQRLRRRPELWLLAVILGVGTLFSLAAPGFLTLSATVRLPIAPLAVQREDESRLRRQLRELEFHSERDLPQPPQPEQAKQEPQPEPPQPQPPAQEKPQPDTPQPDTAEDTPQPDPAKPEQAAPKQEDTSPDSTAPDLFSLQDEDPSKMQSETKPKPATKTETKKSNPSKTTTKSSSKPQKKKLAALDLSTQAMDKDFDGVRSDFVADAVEAVC